MRNILTVTVGVMALSAAAMVAQPSSQSFTGTISDSMCGAHHMMKNATPAQCTRECVKDGSDFVLLSGPKTYILKGDKADLDKFAGQKVTIKGQASGNTITVQSVAP